MDSYKKLKKEINQTQDKLAEGISSIIRNINNKERIVAFLKNMKNQPTEDTLKRVNKIAFENEDYETCDAIKEYTNQRGLTL